MPKSFSEEGKWQPRGPEVQPTVTETSAVTGFESPAEDEVQTVRKKNKLKKNPISSVGEDGSFTVRGDLKYIYKWEGDTLKARRSNSGWFAIDTSKISSKWEGLMVKPLKKGKENKAIPSKGVGNFPPGSVNFDVNARPNEIPPSNGGFGQRADQGVFSQESIDFDVNQSPSSLLTALLQKFTGGK